MNRPADFDRDANFDAQARRLHQASLSRLSPQTLAQLRSARAATRASSTRRWPWLAATAFSGLLAVGIGLQWMPDAGTGTTATSTPMIASQIGTQSSGDSSAMLEENPELYLWLASAEAQPLAME